MSQSNEVEVGDIWQYSDGTPYMILKVHKAFRDTQVYCLNTHQISDCYPISSFFQKLNDGTNRWKLLVRPNK